MRTMMGVAEEVVAKVVVREGEEVGGVRWRELDGKGGTKRLTDQMTRDTNSRAVLTLSPSRRREQIYRYGAADV